MSTKIHPIIKEFLNNIKIRLYSDHTFRAYKYDLYDYINFCEEFKPNNNFIHLDNVVIKEYLQRVSSAGLSGKTLARRLASIKSLYKFMLENNYIDVNIAETIKTPKVIKDLPQFLSLKQVKKILTLPAGDDLRSVMEKLILELFYATGMRISELISIRFQDVRLEESVIYIIGKRNKERVVMIGTEAKLTLKTYIKLLNIKLDSKLGIYLFPSLMKSNSGHISNKTVFNIVKKYMKKVSNDEKLSPHSLRHSFATHMLSNGADLMAIKDLLGHASLSSTQIYTHLQPEKLSKIYKKAHPHGK